MSVSFFQLKHAQDTATTSSGAATADPQLTASAGVEAEAVHEVSAAEEPFSPIPVADITSDSISLSARGDEKLKDEVESLRQQIQIAESQRREVINVMTESLPKILPNVLLNKREELLPMILCLISNHWDCAARDNMSHLLFNLAKRPDAQQRRAILEGFKALAKSMGQDRTESELLPPIWEHLSHKQDERRVLVAEAVAALSPLVRPALRASLLLSILQQLIEDKSSLVRAAVAMSLSALLQFVPDADKFAPVFELLFRLLLDDSQEVNQAATQFLLPSFLDWARSCKYPFSHVLSVFMEKGTLVLNSVGLASASDDNEAIAADYDIRTPLASADKLALTKSQSNTLSLVLSILSNLVPRIKLEVLSDGPFAVWARAKKVESREDEEGMISVLLRQAEEFLDDPRLQEWRSFLYVKDNFMAFLIAVARAVHPINIDIVWAVCSLARDLNIAFGPVISRSVFRPLLEGAFGRSDARTHPSQIIQRQFCRPLPLFVIGVVSTWDDESLVLEQLLSLCVESSTMAGYWRHAAPVSYALDLLCRISSCQEVVIEALCSLTRHAKQDVRICACRHVTSVVHQIGTLLLSRRVVPSLAAALADEVFLVREAALKAAGAVLVASTDGVVVDKLKEALDHVVERAEREDISVLVRVFGSIVPKVPAHMRDYYILPKISSLSTAAVAIQDPAQRMAFAMLVLSCLKAFFDEATLMPVFNHGQDSLSMHLVPSLRNVLRDLDPSDTKVRDVVQDMIIRTNSLLPEDKTKAAPSATGANALKNLFAGDKKDLFGKKDSHDEKEKKKEEKGWDFAVGAMLDKRKDKEKEKEKEEAHKAEAVAAGQPSSSAPDGQNHEGGGEEKGRSSKELERDKDKEGEKKEEKPSGFAGLRRGSLSGKKSVLDKMKNVLYNVPE